MSRFGSDPHAFFQSVYAGAAPWDIGEAQPAMLSIISDYPAADPVLDIGCGSGDLSLRLTRLGHDVVGVDFVQDAIDQAIGKAAQLPPSVARRPTFRAADAMRPSALGVRFGAIFDSGFLHLLDPGETDRFLEDVPHALLPGGRYYLHAFAVEFPVANVPRAVTEAEVRVRFSESAGWGILDIRTDVFHNALAPPVPAIVACMERIGGAR